jgi:hypothetical protein
MNQPNFDISGSPHISIARLWMALNQAKGETDTASVTSSYACRRGKLCGTRNSCRRPKRVCVGRTTGFSKSVDGASGGCARRRSTKTGVNRDSAWTFSVQHVSSQERAMGPHVSYFSGARNFYVHGKFCARETNALYIARVEPSTLRKAAGMRQSRKLYLIVFRQMHSGH